MEFQMFSFASTKDVKSFVIYFAVSYVDFML